MEALWLSGGKDSVACLMLARERLHEIHVIWANTGKNLPEVIAWMERLQAMCPNWHEVTTDQAAQNARMGIPADVLPVKFTAYGAMFAGQPPMLVQDYFSCCTENISGPLMEKTRDLGCDTVIRGQRADEAHKAPCRDGDTHAGITYRHPIEDWTAAQVAQYLKGKIEFPAFWTLAHSSLDCYDCTAYLEHSRDRAAYLREHHPEKWQQFMVRLTALQAAIEITSQPMVDILQERAHAHQLH